MATLHTHTPVLLTEVLTALNVRGDGLYVDATFGRGGHSAEILSRLDPKSKMDPESKMSPGRLIALDRDPAAIAAGRERFGNDARLILVRAAFGDIADAARKAMGTENWRGIFNGVLFDLGVSSPQLDDASRGFSFMQDGPLDMRMDTDAGATAAQWLAKAPEGEIARVIREFGEERFAKRIARAIVAVRRERPITTTAQLAAIVAEAVPTREMGKHPATRAFQAIRMQVNDELKQIDGALNQSLDLLASGGRLCVISFHSLEDRLVKNFIQKHSQEDPVYAGLPQVPPHARPKLKRVGRA
ncbi:MAG TPA: 16S rRNA (cytosine(1402)-N(4))-methyltransferase RsmH, partial [Steroidobacteraceae bacterium]|nr:16S rRNA (cytosine(1402)-N(4))-methyltransferase RsmH [Steroidobacteraceae bacterium]